MGTILITGSGRGLGRVTCEKLAGAGHHVFLTARTQAKAEKAANEIATAVPAAKLSPRGLDLASLASVRAFASGLLGEGVTLDLLFNVAGVMQTNPVRELSADGYEVTLAVNALAPFLLTRMLLPALQRAPKARVINVSSRMHLPGSRGKPVDFDFDDPNLERNYNPDRAYKNSKLALLWFTYELQRRLGPSPLTVNAVCPGFVPATARDSSRKPFERWLLKHVLPHFSFTSTVDDATDSFVFMATDPGVGERGGRFFGEKKEIASSPESHDEEKAKRFWALASRLTGLADRYE
jgi:NAD(P)-dependent dehydrogenase (short-subunit alcohol dehydrogenase family)